MGAIRQRQSEQFATLVKNNGGPPRLIASGELDIASAAAFGRELAGLIDERGPDVVVDVSFLTFCDARGLAAFVEADRAARRRGGRITLTGVRPQLAKLLRITGLDRTFARSAP
ncbi:STAS domain-containing protein [Actinomadura syzygii]|uniref:Anti-sigma factor antagonist n=1 Tax=Actinomadura syzygii TaxID=1427538 RepID=A0A5D0UFM1_9ACTN|nr:STAS domain-containing protein [Actinomadura syzygii]TYC16383.1 STAS domain-containing protein [Actinomadura syzygii]